MALFTRAAKTTLLFAVAVVLAGCPRFLSLLTEPEALDADCDNPAPIINEKGEGWTEELGYSVVYHEDTDRTPEETGNLTARRAEKYDFTP